MTDPEHDGAILDRGIVRQLAAMRDYLDELRPGAGRALEALERWHDVELTYTSLAIEGSLLTRAETAAVLEHGLPTDGAKPLHDHQAAIGHMQALNHVRALARDAAPIREVEVRRIHALVLSGIDPGTAEAGPHRGAGCYSSRPRRIAGSAVVLPGPAELPALMGDLARWLGTAPATPETAFEAHWRLVAIHPFNDGNGRVGRLLMNLVLLRGGYTPVLIGPEHRAAYLDALERRGGGDAEPYAGFMASRLFDSLLHALHIAAGEARKETQVRGPTPPGREESSPGTTPDDLEGGRADEPPGAQGRAGEDSPP